MLTDIMDLNSKLILGKMETIKQLKKIILLSFMLLSYSTLKAQKVFTVDAYWKAEKKVYFVDADWKADLKIYFVYSDWKAKWVDKSKISLMY